MKQHNRLCVILFLVLATFEVTEAIESLDNFAFDAQPDPALQKYFLPEKSGWLGGDVASSTSLGGDKYLWIWGDTLVGNVQNNQRVITAMPRNSLATARVTNGAPQDKLNFHIRINKTNENGGFFSPDSKEHWYWPVNGLIINNILYIMAYNVYADGGGPFGFAFQGTTVIRVTNPSADPDQWNWSVSDMSYSNGQLNWASGIVTDQKHVYLYGSSTSQGTVLSRYTVDEFAQNKWTNQQFWASDEDHDEIDWISFNATDKQDSLVAVLTPSISELSVTYHSYLNAWVTINMEFAGTQILIAVADDLTGPWSDWYSIYDVPAPYNNTKQVFCYALKRHPEFEHASNELVLTYMSNTYDVNDLNKMLNVYVPQVVRVQISKASIAKRTTAQ